MNKSELTNLLANDDLDAAIQGLAGYARKYANPELYSEALIISGRLEEYKKQTRIGAAAYDTLLQHRAGVRAALMDLIKGLPETPNITLPSGKLPGLSEDKFKSSLFWLILSGNIVILFWLWLER